MDNIRLFLWAGMGLLIWLTLQAWQRDFADVPVPAPAPAAATAAQGAPQSTPADLPDLPDAAPAQADGPNAPPTVASAPSSQMVKVLTDVLDLRIDLAGGDIRGASLPLYLHSDIRSATGPYEILFKPGQMVGERDGSNAIEKGVGLALSLLRVVSSVPHYQMQCADSRTERIEAGQ